MNIDLINSIIKNFFIILFSNMIVLKVLNKKDIKMTLCVSIIIFSFITTFIYITIKEYTNSMFSLLILCIMLNLLVTKILGTETSLTITTILVSLSICFVTFGISVILNYLIWSNIKIENNFLELFSIILLQFLLINGFFKIKRFKNGFHFLQNNNEYIDIIMINISIIIIYIYSVFGTYSGNELTKNIFITLMGLGIIMIITIQKILILNYKQNLLKKTIEDYKNEIEEKDKKIKELSNEKFNISKLNHEFYNRQKSLELKIKEMNLETSEEIGILQRIQTVTEEYSTKLQQIKGKNKLPLTNVETIDDMLKYMQTECYNKNIDFKLQIEANINRLINNKISETRLETLIGDHIKDAIIAVNNSNNKYKSIMTIIGIKDNCYELCIYDSGIEFEIPTLLNLGLEAITTHKDTGGSGIGFITTFETLKYCKASLIIEERHKEIENDYTKAVIIRFDDKNEYKIRSYRAKEIIRQAKDNRIIIENI